MKYNFSLGVFLNIKTNDIDIIKKEIDMIEHLEGVEHIEIWREVEHMSDEIHDLILSLKKKYRLIIHAPFINITLASHHHAINNASIDILQKFYNWGVDIGAEVFTIHGGHKPFFQSSEQDIKHIIQSLKYLKIQKKLQCTLEHMPLGKHFSTAPNSLMNLVDLEDVVSKLEHFEFTLDIGHVLQNQENWKKWVEKHIDYIYDIHLHDGFLNGKAHLALGTADLDCNDFFEFLVDHNYNKFISTEVVGLSETKQSWKYLKKQGLLKHI